MLSKTVKCLIFNIQTNRQHDRNIMLLFYALKKKSMRTINCNFMIRMINITGK
jgi:hypothetical protein